MPPTHPITGLPNPVPFTPPTSTGNTVNVLMISGIVVALLILIVSPVVYCLTRTKDISSSDNHHQPG